MKIQFFQYIMLPAMSNEFQNFEGTKWREDEGMTIL
jgi:hypothetical protein